MKQDRKINLILKDKGIEEYVSLDITDINIDVEQDLSEYPPEVQRTLQEKLAFRKKLAHMASITKLNYYGTMMRKVFNNVNIPQPQNYLDKLKHLQK